MDQTAVRHVLLSTSSTVIVSLSTDQRTLMVCYRFLTHRPVFYLGVERQQIPIRWLSLTDFHVPIGRGASTPVLKEAFSKSGVVEAWKKTAWAKKLANREAKKSLTDFDRFRVMVAKKRVNHAVNTEMKRVKKTVSKRK
jgi:large subunit ribosomal protein L14e